MSDQQWEPVVLRKHGHGGGGKSAKKQETTAASRSGQAEPVKKYAGGVNRSLGPSNARSLDEETEDFSHQQITHSFKVALMKARSAKKLNQKQLAQLINEKPTVIADYEAGRAIPNGQLISKLNRVLGCKLPKIPKKSKNTE